MSIPVGDADLKPTAEKGELFVARMAYAIFLLCALLISLLLLENILRSDDTTYFEIAKMFPPSLDVWEKWYGMHHYFRVGLYMYGALIQALLGYTITAYYVASISLHLILFTVIFWLARRINGLPSAIYAALFFLTSFLCNFRATNFMTDRPAAACALLSFFVFIVACQSKRNLGLLFLAAFLAFYSYLCRLPLIIFPACFPLYEFLRYRSIRRSVYCFLFLGMLVSLEGLAYWFLMGDFWARLYSVKVSIQRYSVQVVQPTWIGFLLIVPLKFLESFSGKILFLCSLSGTILACRRKNYELLALIAGSALLFCLMAYNAQSYFPLKVGANVNKYRQYILFFSVAAMASGYFMSWLVPQLRKRFTWGKVGGVALVAVLIGLQVYELPRKMNNRILAGHDDYFVMSRIIDSGLKSGQLILSELKGKLYCARLREFGIFPAIKQLDPIGLDLIRPPKPPFYAIVDKHRVESWRRYLQRDKQDVYLNNIRKLLHPDNVILSQNQLMFVHYTGGDIVERKFYSLNAPLPDDLSSVEPKMKQDQWYATSLSAENGMDITFSDLPPHDFFYANLFALKGAHDTLLGRSSVRFDAVIETIPNRPVGARHLTLWVLCYSGEERVLKRNLKVLPPVPGEEQRIEFTFNPPKAADRMEVYLRMGRLDEPGGVRIKRLDLFDVTLKKD